MDIAFLVLLCHAVLVDDGPCLYTLCCFTRLVGLAGINV